MTAVHNLKCVYQVPVCVYYPLAISQVDLSKGGVEFWRWLTLVVFIQEDRRAADLYAQLLCALRHRETKRTREKRDRNRETKGQK